MPTYEYECTSCKGTFEVFQSISERPKKKCPLCRRLTARRRIGPGAAILFKGNGFYQTDYRSSEYRKKAKQEKDSSTPAPKSDATGKASSSAKSSGAKDD